MATLLFCEHGDWGCCSNESSAYMRFCRCGVILRWIIILFWISASASIAQHLTTIAGCCCYIECVYSIRIGYSFNLFFFYRFFFATLWIWWLNLCALVCVCAVKARCFRSKATQCHTRKIRKNFAVNVVVICYCGWWFFFFSISDRVNRLYLK